MSKWKLRPYQIQGVKEVKPVLIKNNIVYINWEERTGKTGVALGLAQEVRPDNHILILTKAVAVEDWKKQLKNFGFTFTYTVSSYHSAHKVRVRPSLVILDEAHNYISSVPKAGKIWKDVNKLVYGSPIIYISATPHAQGYHMLYHQFKLSAWSPWKTYKDYYSWYRNYALRNSAGNTEKKWLNGREVETYTCLQDDLVKSCVDHLFHTKTRQELGFPYEPTDKIHYIKLSENTVKACKQLITKRVLSFSVGGKEYKHIADSVTRLRVALHQLEGGTLIAHDTKTSKDKKVKTVGDKVILSECNKVQFILDEFGDTKDLAIMYNFKLERDKLESKFTKALILQATRNAEGVDLSHVKHLVIYSNDYSTARFTQRRARQAGKDRDSPIVVHHLLVKGGLSDQVYKTVCLNKQNFVDSRFKLKEVKL